MAGSFEKEQCVQYFPTSPNDNARRPGARGSRVTVAIPTTEEHRDQDELDATAEWIAHLAARRIEVR